MKAIPVHIVTGFLGSGKTTFLKHILNHVDTDRKLAIIQNEFAAANFDGKELKRDTNRHFEILEVNNGSVFCVCLLSGFIQSFAAFIEKYQPDMVFFETSGLSDPIAVAELFNADSLQGKAYLASSIGIVDASSFLKLQQLQQQMRHQVQIADIILLNKTDLVQDTEQIVRKIRTINQLASIHQTSYCEIDLVNLPKIINRNDGALKPQLDVFPATSVRPQAIKTAVLKTVRPMKDDQLNNFLHAVKKELLRLKGNVLLKSGKVKLIQMTIGQTEIFDTDTTIKQTELITIGYSFNVSELKALYQQYC